MVYSVFQISKQGQTKREISEFSRRSRWAQNISMPPRGPPAQIRDSHDLGIFWNMMSTDKLQKSLDLRRLFEPAAQIGNLTTQNIQKQ